MGTQKAGNSNYGRVLCVLPTRNLLSCVNVFSEDFVCSFYPSHQEPHSYQYKRSTYVDMYRHIRMSYVSVSNVVTVCESTLVMRVDEAHIGSFHFSDVCNVHMVYVHIWCGNVL